MLRGLYIAATALEKDTKRLDIISNNLANIKTTGYKRDDAISEEFSSMLLLKENGFNRTIINKKPNVEFKQIKDFYEVHTKKGFFRVIANGGISNDTTMRFKINKDGYVTTPYDDYEIKGINEYGYKVLSSDNKPIKISDDLLATAQNTDNNGEELRTPKLNVNVDEFGNLFVNSQKVANLLYNQNLHTIGTMSGGSLVNRTFTNYEQGSFQDTENPLDLALDSEGFFTIITEDGDRYTRNGEFKLTPEGKLVTSDGTPVKGINGEINISSNDYWINELGEVYVDSQLVDKLEIIVPEKIEYMTKQGNNLYKYTGDLKDKGFKGRVISGYLETSNVDSVTEMVKMIETFRNYESSQRILKTYDDLLGSAVNQIARF